MPQSSPPQASCRVFTFKEGVLSAIAHDLELEVTRFTVTWTDDERSVEATFDPASLRVLTPLSPSDRAEIEANIRDKVLQVRQFPRIAFTSGKIEGGVVQGILELHGQQREIRGRVSGRRCEVEVHQPDFGILPYRAALGTLRVKPVVRVRVTLNG